MSFGICPAASQPINRARSKADVQKPNSRVSEKALGKIMPISPSRNLRVRLKTRLSQRLPPLKTQRKISLGQRIKNTESEQPSNEACRLDVWLFRTRLLKTRSLATKMILGGKIRVTRHGKTERTQKPGLCLKPGEQVTFMRGSQLIHVEMVAAGTRRGPAPEAQSLYRDHSAA